MSDINIGLAMQAIVAALPLVEQAFNVKCGPLTIGSDSLHADIMYDDLVVGSVGFHTNGFDIYIERLWPHWSPRFPSVAEAIEWLSNQDAEAAYWAERRGEGNDEILERRETSRITKRAERDAYRAADPTGFAVKYGYGEMVNGVYTPHEDAEDYDGADYVFAF